MTTLLYTQAYLPIHACSDDPLRPIDTLPINTVLNGLVYERLYKWHYINNYKFLLFSGVLTREEAARVLLNVHHAIKHGVYPVDAMTPEDHDQHIERLRTAFDRLAVATAEVERIKRLKLALYSQQKLKHLKK